MRAPVAFSLLYMNRRGNKEKREERGKGEREREKQERNGKKVGYIATGRIVSTKLRPT